MPEYLTAIIFAAAFLIDSAMGDPEYRLHPVRLIGVVIDHTKKMLFRIGLNGKFGGFFVTSIAICITAGSYLAFRRLLTLMHPILVLSLDIFAVYSSFALKDLFKHARLVADNLEAGNIDMARTDLNRLVGRNCASLKHDGIARATIESIAEGFVDGFFAPILWFTTGALVAEAFGIHILPTAVTCILIYRVVNTLDSMIGYKDKENRKFGSFAARLDDWLNFIPARLSVIALIPAALFNRLDAREGINVFIRDRLNHESPNSAHTESFVAGAMNLKLGGPTEYPRGIVEKPWLGNGSQNAMETQIKRVCSLINTAGWITALGLAIILWL